MSTQQVEVAGAQYNVYLPTQIKVGLKPVSIITQRETRNIAYVRLENMDISRLY